MKTLANRFLIVAVILVCGCISGIHSQTPAKPPAAKLSSIFPGNTLFTVYGLTFDRAPILGHLGTYKNFAEMEKDIQPKVQEIRQRNDRKGVVPAIHLIYAMAIPCKPKDDCLMYLEGRVKNLAGEYIEPAAKRGWMVVLDTQIGKSNPVDQVKRIIDKGYLKYENVAIAIDPEFRTRNESKTPGRPVGTVPADQINKVQQMLDDYVRNQKQAKKKVLIVHQFGDPNVNDGVPFMIEDKKNLKTYDNVDLVINMDGFGKQDVKTVKYNKITDSKIYPFIKYRGIKVFYPNRWEKRGHYDKPPMNWDQIFGLKPTEGGAKIRVKPDVVIIA
jgi:hypothetical protein